MDAADPFRRVGGKVLILYGLAFLVDVPELCDDPVGIGLQCGAREYFEAVVIHPVVRVAQKDVSSLCRVEQPVPGLEDAHVMLVHEEPDVHLGVLGHILADDLDRIVARAVVAHDDFIILEPLSSYGIKGSSRISCVVVACEGNADEGLALYRRPVKSRIYVEVFGDDFVLCLVALVILAPECPELVEQEVDRDADHEVKKGRDQLVDVKDVYPQP